MGGERETTLEKTKTDKGKKADFGGFRIHESSGEMHVHDDKKKLKCAVPIAKAWKFWDAISGQVGEIRYADPVNKTVLTLKTDVTNNQLDASITLESITVGDNYNKLHEFLKRK